MRSPFNSKPTLRRLEEPIHPNLSNKLCSLCGSYISGEPYRSPPTKSPAPAKVKVLKQRWYSKMDWYKFFRNLWDYTIKFFVTLVVVAAIGFVGFLSFKCISSPNKIDYCYVGSGTRGWTLYGNVPWGFDRHLGNFQETYVAQKYAQKINCPLDITPNDNVPYDGAMPVMAP